MAELTSARWWNSPLVGKLHLFAAFAVIPLLLHLAFEEDVTWLAGVAMFVAIFTLTLIRWPYGALSVVIAASAIPVYFVEISGWKADRKSVV